MNGVLIGTIAAFWAGMGYAGVLKAVGKRCVFRPLFRWAANGLLIGIGLKAGLAVVGAQTEADPELVSILILATVGVAWGFVMPRLLTSGLARWLGWSSRDAALLAGTYGSVSVMTFALATAYLERGWIAISGLFSLILLLMELPALLSVAAKWGAPMTVAESGQPTASAPTWKSSALGHLFGNSVVQVMLGSAAVGAALASFGQKQLVQQALHLMPFCIPVFLFGQGSSLPEDWRALFQRSNLRLLLVGVLLPLLQGLLGFCIAMIAGCKAPGVALFAILMGSASYLAAPALLGKFFRSDKLPLCTAVSLTITFPFNVLVGIPLWTALAQCGVVEALFRGWMP